MEEAVSRGKKITMKVRKRKMKIVQTGLMYLVGIRKRLIYHKRIIVITVVINSL